MDLLKHMTPKGFLKRWVGTPSVGAAPHHSLSHAAQAPLPEPFETTIDRYEANLPSIHKLICRNRELCEHHLAEMRDAQGLHARAVKSFRYRALGALPLCTLALEMNELSQAGLASVNASGVTWISGTAAAFLACMSLVALRTAGLAQRRAAVSLVRQDELQGVIDREARAAVRTSTALRTMRRKRRRPSSDTTRAASAATMVAHHPVLPLQDYGDGVSSLLLGSAHAQLTPPRPMPMDSETSAGTTYHVTQQTLG